jgi:glycosyltransferase involved in cell wall biosynthesis
MRVCLITTGQPSSNPRLVKEADALVEAGHDVHVIAAYWAEWATIADARVLATRKWSYTFVDWRRETAPWLFWKTRLRHRAALALQPAPLVWRICLPAALSRVTPELTRAALRTPADLYIAHNLGALPAAAAAARRHRSRLGFDAEDYHRAEFAFDDRSARRLAVERAEERLLPRCDYLTAAAPAVAEAYAPYSRHGQPVCILNVFPRASCPPARPRTAPSGPLRLYWFSQTIGAKRGLEDVVRAMGRFADGTIELHLRGQWQPGYHEALQATAAAAGLNAARVVWHEPAASDEMVRLAAAFDVGLAVEPATTVNSDIILSNKIFTYLLAGLAIVATRTRGQEAFLERIPGAAVGYDPGDTDRLAARLEHWMTDRGALDRARETAWALGTARYNWDTEKQRFLTVIQEVLRRPAPDPFEWPSPNPYGPVHGQVHS